MAKRRITKPTSISKDQLTVVLEDMNSKFDLVIESNQQIRKSVDKFSNRMVSMEHKVDNLETSTFSLNHRVDQLEKGQRLTLDYLARIEAELHGEVQTKVGVKEFAILQKRVDRLEKQMSKAHG